MIHYSSHCFIITIRIKDKLFLATIHIKLTYIKHSCITAVVIPSSQIIVCLPHFYTTLAGSAWFSRIPIRPCDIAIRCRPISNSSKHLLYCLKSISCTDCLYTIIFWKALYWTRSSSNVFMTHHEFLTINSWNLVLLFFADWV